MANRTLVLIDEDGNGRVDLRIAQSRVSSPAPTSIFDALAPEEAEAAMPGR